MSNNVTREQHLEALANAAQQFALSTQNDTLNLVIEAFQAAGNSSAASTTPTMPTLSLGAWSKNDTTYTASLSYSGDGTLSSNIGSISGTTLSVIDDDGSFNGVVTATAGTSYAATTLNFSYTEEASDSMPQTLYLPIGYSGISDVEIATKYTYEQRNLLNAEDKAAFESAYEDVQALITQGKNIVEFSWLAGTVEVASGNEIFYLFVATGANLTVKYKGNTMETKKGTASNGNYFSGYARLTENGIYTPKGALIIYTD